MGSFLTYAMLNVMSGFWPILVTAMLAAALLAPVVPLTLTMNEFQQKVLPHPYAFNLFSHNSKIDPATGYNEEETKMLKVL